MTRQLTKELAEKIRKKLKGKKGKRSGAHQIYSVFDDDGKTLITTLSIRHGSERDLGHDHLQDDLYLNSHKAKALAHCNISREQWIGLLIKDGHFSRS